jgi:hypothetical protein
MRVQQLIVLGGLGAVLGAPIAEPEPAPVAQFDYKNYGGKYLELTPLYNILADTCYSRLWQLVSHITFHRS